MEIKALACELPARLQLPLSRLSIADLRAEALRQGLVATISETTIWRWLAEDAIRPWTHRSWVFPRDPDFGRLAGRVVDLYAREWKGKPLGRRDFVLCADEKTSIQARARPHPTTPPGPEQAMRVEHEYVPGGVRSPTWRRGMCIGPSCLATANHARASRRLGAWSIRS